MKSFFFAIRIALVFTVVLALALAGTFVLFVRVAGGDMMHELSFRRALEGVEAATEIEAVLAPESASINSAAVQAELAAQSKARHLEMSLAKPRNEAPDGWLGGGHRPPVSIGGRPCRFLGWPDFETIIPLYRDGKPAADLVLSGWDHVAAIHRAFHYGLIRIGGLALVFVLLLTLYLTAPLRRMSRSMDRIAAGELEHRVSASGRDEVAAMGRSFNAMADRIHDMVVGQKELMAGVSHELRSPLTRMKMSLELMGSRAPAGRLEELGSEVDQLDSLVEELLLASRFDLGAVALETAELDLSELAASAWQRIAHGDESELQLTTHFEPGAELAIADRGLMLRALGNLFENAARYGGKRVRFTSERVGDGLRLSVIDDGPGVDDDHLEHLFEPFFRADPSRSRGTGAAGLGLMIVRRAIEAHGGQVQAKRGQAGGLTVEFTLPEAPEAAEAPETAVSR